MRWRHLNGNLIAEDEHGLNLTGGIILKFVWEVPLLHVGDDRNRPFGLKKGDHDCLIEVPAKQRWKLQEEAEKISGLWPPTA